MKRTELKEDIIEKGLKCKGHNQNLNKEDENDKEHE